MDDSPPPAPRSIPPELPAAFADDGDQSVFETGNAPLDGVFGSEISLEEPPLPDLPTAPPPTLPDEILKTREEFSSGATYSSSSSMERRSISPGFPPSHERKPGVSRDEESRTEFVKRLPEASLHDASSSLPIEPLPTTGDRLIHLTRVRPRRVVNKPSRDALRSVPSRDDSAYELQVEKEKSPWPSSSVSEPFSTSNTASKVSKERNSGRFTKTRKENSIAAAPDKEHPTKGTTGILHDSQFAVSERSKQDSPSLVDVVQKVKPSLAAHQKVAPTSFSSRLKKIRRTRGSQFSAGGFNDESPGRSPALTNLTGSPYVHSYASNSSLGSETLSLSATSAVSLADDMLTGQEKASGKTEEREDGRQINAGAFRVSSPLDSPQLLVHPVVPDSVSSITDAPSGTLRSSSPPLLPSPPPSLSPDKQPPLANATLERVRVVSVDEVEWPSPSFSSPEKNTGDGLEVSRDLFQSPSLPQDFYETNKEEFNQTPAELEGPPPPLPPSSHPPPLPSEPLEEERDLQLEMMAISQVSEQSSSLQLSPLNIELSSEPSSTLTIVSDNKSSYTDSNQLYVENEGQMQYIVDKQRRVERSRSVYSDTAEKESALLKPNLKRWGATELDRISYHSGSSDILPESSVAPLVGQGREQRSAKSAMEFTLRPRSSSGLSWVSAETADRSLESIVEVAPNTLLAEFAEPVVKQRPSTAIIPRPHATYLMEDELTSSASTGNIAYSHELASGQPLEALFEQPGSNFGKTSIFPTVSAPPQDRLPLKAEPAMSRRDALSVDHPVTEDSAPAVHDYNSKSSETLPTSPPGDIPKSISSLLESVVSDFPLLATSSAVVDNANASSSASPLPPPPARIDTGDLIPAAVPCQAAWSETTLMSSTPTMDVGVEETDLTLPRFQLHLAQKDLKFSSSGEQVLTPVTSTTAMAAVATGVSTTQPSATYFSPGDSSAASVIQEGTPFRHEQTRLTTPSPSVGKSPSQVSRDVDKQHSDGSTKVIRLYIRGIHPGIEYKAFKVTPLTTCHHLISEALEKCNVVQDANLFAIYEVRDSEEPVRVLKMEEPPLNAYRQEQRENRQEEGKAKPESTTPPTHLEMRRTTEKGKQMMIKVALVDKPHQEVKLKISSVTSARELVELSLKKAGLWKFVGPWTEPYCLLGKETSEQADYILQSDVAIARQYPEGSTFQLVDMLSYLPAVAETRERRTSVVTMVNRDDVHDIDAARIIIGKCQKLIQSMERELHVSEYNVEQLRKDLQESKAISEQVGAYQKTIETMDSAFKEQQQSASNTIKSLQAKISRLTSENESKDQLHSFTKGSNRMNTLSSYSLSSNDEQLRSLERSLEAHQKTIEVIDKERGELLKRLEMQELEISSLKVENNRLQVVLQEGNFIDAFDSHNDSNPLIRPTLFELMSHQPMQAVIPVEVIPTDQGLGVKLTEDYGGKGGCIVKAVADYSSARSLLTPGDRLLEVNGLDVTSLMPRAISDLLQQEPGLVQMVVSRLIPLAGCSDSASASEGDIRSSYDELQRDKESLTLQLSQQDSVDKSWRELHDQAVKKLDQNDKKIVELEKVLHQRNLRIEELESFCDKYQQQLAEEQTRKITDLKSLREMVVAEQPLSCSEFESLADTLSDAKPSELMNALRTIESECLKNKEYLNQLLAVVVDHCPRLLSIMASIQREEKGDMAHDSATDDLGDECEIDNGWC